MQPEQTGNTKYIYDLFDELDTYTDLDIIQKDLERVIARGKKEGWKKLQLEIEDAGGIVITGQRPETKAERKKRLKADQKDERSRETDERELYESLKAKFDP